MIGAISPCLNTRQFAVAAHRTHSTLAAATPHTTHHTAATPHTTHHHTTPHHHSTESPHTPVVPFVCIALLRASTATRPHHTQHTSMALSCGHATYLAGRPSPCVPQAGWPAALPASTSSPQRRCRQCWRLAAQSGGPTRPEEPPQHPSAPQSAPQPASPLQEPIATQSLPGPSAQQFREAALQASW